MRDGSLTANGPFDLDLGECARRHVVPDEESELTEASAPCTELSSG